MTQLNDLPFSVLQHLATFGAREIPRPEFAQRLSELVDYEPIPAPWRFDADAIGCRVVN